MLRPRKINFTRRRGNKRRVQLILNIARSNKRDKAKRTRSAALYFRRLETRFRVLRSVCSIVARLTDGRGSWNVVRDFPTAYAYSSVGKCLSVYLIASPLWYPEIRELRAIVARDSLPDRERRIQSRDTFLLLSRAS